MQTTFKGNAQFLFLWNSPKSRASRVCITFPQNNSAFLIFQKIFKKVNKKNYISNIFWTFKGKLQIIHADTYIALFLSDSNNSFYMFSTIYPYLSLIFSHFVFLFWPYSTINNVWFDFITTCRNITEKKKCFIAHDKRKSATLPKPNAIAEAKIFFCFHILMNILLVWIIIIVLWQKNLLKKFYTESYH